MEKIMVIGVSAGVGKSTFARKLSTILQIEAYHLDTLFWEPNWVEASIEIFSRRQKEIVKKTEWIIEGNYSKTFDLREEFADTIIYLELPLSVCLSRVLKRWLINIGKERPDRASGCEEKMDFTFLKFIYRTYYQRKKTLAVRLQDLKGSKNIVILRNNKEVEQYLKEMFMLKSTNNRR